MAVAGCRNGNLVRAEVVTPREQEAEWQAAERADSGGDTSSPSPPSTVDVVGDAFLRDADHDSLTGLPDRERFIDEVRRALAGGDPASATQAVMSCPLTPSTSSSRLGGARCPTTYWRRSRPG